MRVPIVLKTDDALRSEVGVVLWLVAALLIVIIGIVALMVDLSRESLSVISVQKAADAAALSAASQLNGTSTGWAAARSAALVALANNSIEGVGTLKGVNNSGTWRTKKNNIYGTATIGIFDNVEVTLARGILWYYRELNNNQGGKRFVSLEEGAQDIEGPWSHGDFNNRILANAVKVIVNIVSLETSFGKALGKESFENLQGVSVAVADNRLDLPVVPMAIPFCQLMLNTNPHVRSNHRLTDYNPSFQSSRELVFTELAGFDTGSEQNNSVGQHSLPNYTKKRHEGFARYLSHIQKPVVAYGGSYSICHETIVNGKDIGCKHVPIQGLLGMAGNEKGFIETAEFAALMSKVNQQQQPRINIGMHFKPLRVWSSGVGDIKEASEEMQKFIDDGNSTIGETFLFEENDNTYAKTNFPALRTSQNVDLATGDVLCEESDYQQRPCNYPGIGVDRNRHRRIRWKETIGGTATDLSLLTQDIEPGRLDGTYVPFSNPMCNSTNENLNSPSSRVRRALVMVIAPSFDSSTNRDTLASYCDFENLFNKLPQTTRIPWVDNQPRVIGVVPVNFFGFNFQDLDAVAAFQPSTTANNETASPYYEDNSQNPPQIVTDEFSPQELEFEGGVWKSGVEDFKNEYEACEPPADDVNDFPPGSPGPGPKQPSQNQNNDGCGLYDVTPPVVPPLPGMPLRPGEPPVPSLDPDMRGTFFDCFQDDLREFRNAVNALNVALQDCMDAGSTPDECAGKQNVIDALDKINTNFRSTKDTHCVPLPAKGAYDLTKKDSHEPLHPLVAGRGCGGVRARVSLDEGEPVLLQSGKRWREQKPMIFEEGQ